MTQRGGTDSGLIEDEQLRAMQQRRSERQAPLLTYTHASARSGQALEEQQRLRSAMLKQRRRASGELAHETRLVGELQERHQRGTPLTKLLTYQEGIREEGEGRGKRHGDK